MQQLGDGEGDVPMIQGMNDLRAFSPNNKERLLMMFKLRQCAEKNWRKLRGLDYLAKVIEGVQFSDGIEVIPEIRIAA